MAMMRIARKHHLGAAEAKQRVLAMEPALRKEYGLDVHWHGNRGTFSGRKISGVIDVDDEKVEVDLNLGLAARLFAGKIRQALAAQMARALAVRAEEGLAPSHA